jgi:arylsulfatase A-like enzyme
MGCAGNRELRTPNLDRLAATGTRFDHFFCASPVCSPARASILTGRMPSQHGVHDWLCAGNCTADSVGDGRLIQYLEGIPAFTDYLAAAGYACGLSGKWHLGDAHHAQKSFSFWEVHGRGGGPYYAAPMIRDGEVYTETRYVTEVFTDNALRFLEDQRTVASPFYLGVHYTAPHSPWDRANHPADLWDHYAACPLVSTPNATLHPWQRAMGITPDNRDTRRREMLSGYFAAIEAMDTQVGRILDWLEAAGLRDNTLVLFTSDNGMNMGHHGVYGKGNGTYPMNMYDTSVKVPMLISRPGHVRSGHCDTGLHSHCDLFPTLLEYAGVANPLADILPGRSIAPRLHGRDGASQDHVVVHDEYGPVRMIHTADWKYVHRWFFGPHELYNLSEDPDETVNRVSDPACQATVRDLRTRLDEWFTRYSSPDVDGTREAVTGSGQRDRAGLRGSARQGVSPYMPLA